MAKKHSHKKSNYSLQFLLPRREEKNSSPPPLRALIEKLNSEEIIHWDQSSDIQNGYVVVLESFRPESQIHPGEFTQLTLPEANSEKVYWNFTFNGKKDSGPGGLILPSDVMRYLTSVFAGKEIPKTGVIRLILEKLGFSRKELSINQEPPFKSR